MLKIKPVKVERRRIKVMIGSVTKNIQIYQIRAKSLESGVYTKVEGRGSTVHVEGRGSRVEGKVEGPKMSLKVREKPRVIRVIIYFLFLK